MFAVPFFKYCVYCAGLKIDVVGTPAFKDANFYVSNHVSYLDIPLLASLVDGVFVAKTAVANWPVIGFLARISQTHFVSRKAIDIPKEKEKISAYLDRGHSFFLFPEGTSGNGANLLPFKSGLLSAAQSSDHATENVIQPITLVYGTDIDQTTRDKYAWYGDMALAPHIWRLLKRHEPFTVSIVFHETASSRDFDNRKQLAYWAETSVQAGLNTPIVFNQAAE